MKIKLLEHSVDGNNQELFSLVGGFAMNRQIADLLGNNIYSEAGQMWFIANDGTNTIGFASLLIQKNKKGKLFNLYTTNKADIEVKKQLINIVLETAKTKACKEVHCTDFVDNQTFWREIGFEGKGLRGINYALYTKEIKQ